MTDKGILTLPGALKKEEGALSTEQKLFAQAWHRQSWAMFDNLGIDMNKKKLRGTPVMNYLQGQLYGYGGSWLTRLWCRKIRPQFFKLQQIALEEAYRTISEVLQDERRQLILTQAKEKGLIDERP